MSGQPGEAQIAVNPARATQAPKRPKPDLRVPTGEELRRIVEAARGTLWETAVLLSATTGMRRGELLGLQWRHVDFDTGRLHIEQALTWNYRNDENSYELTLPKTARSVRIVPLAPDVVARLKQHRRGQAERLLGLGVRADGDVFVIDRGDGRPVEPSTYTHALRRIVKQVGLEGVRLHDLRHGAVTAMLKQGVRPELVSKMVGHSTTAFTLSVYAHPTVDELDDCADAIARAIGGEA